MIGVRNGAVGFAMALIVMLGVAPPTHAQRAATGPPDWPCVQRLIPELSWGTVWAGPSLDELEREWWDDEEVASVVRYATARETDDDAALQRVRDFVESTADDDDREERLTLLFAGLFERIDRERGRTIERIRGASRAQVARLETLSEMVDRLEERRGEEDPAQDEIERLEQELHWEKRAFEMRQQTLPAMCEKPYLLEEQLGRMVRVIREAM